MSVSRELIAFSDEWHEPLLDVWVTSWHATMPQIDFDARRAWFVDHLKGLHANGAQTVCAIAGSDLLGFVTIDPQTGHLDQLAVAPEQFGSGLAIQLLDEARARSSKAVYLDVNCDNNRACRFYQRQGFVVDGEGVNPRSGLKTWRMVSGKKL